jgi:hypothetical protein
LVADPIAELRSPEGALISMYMERPSPGGFSALISDLGRDVRDVARARDRVVQKSVEADIHRIRGEADRFELEGVPAYAVFASSVNAIYQIKPLAHPVASRSTLGSRPYLRPLRAEPRPSRTAILVADRAVARVFVGYEGSIAEEGAPLSADAGKANFGGFAGYEEHTVRSRADEVAARLWREAGQRLFDSHQDTPFDSIVIGCQEEAVDDIRNQLHPYLRALPHGSFPVSPSEVSIHRLRHEVDEQNRAIREEREMALVSALMAAASRGTGAVVGLADTLRMANVQGISDLVVAGSFSRPGVMCPACGFLGRDGKVCEVCGTGMHEVADVVAALIDATVEAGGLVHQVVVGSVLDRDGVGALTRFDIGGLD